MSRRAKKKRKRELFELAMWYVWIMISLRLSIFFSRALESVWKRKEKKN
jgi:hypothetical protein